MAQKKILHGKKLPANLLFIFDPFSLSIIMEMLTYYISRTDFLAFQILPYNIWGSLFYPQILFLKKKGFFQVLATEYLKIHLNILKC